MWFSLLFLSYLLILIWGTGDRYGCLWESKSAHMYVILICKEASIAPHFTCVFASSFVKILFMFVSNLITLFCF